MTLKGMPIFDHVQPVMIEVFFGFLELVSIPSKHLSLQSQQQKL